MHGYKHHANNSNSSGVMLNPAKLTYACKHMYALRNVQPGEFSNKMTAGSTSDSSELPADLHSNKDNEHALCKIGLKS
jgi:hypothetical protein